jgi:hypothetical protein
MIAAQSTRVSRVMISDMCSAESDEGEDRQDNDDEADEIDDVAHVGSLLRAWVRDARTSRP